MGIGSTKSASIPAPQGNCPYCTAAPMRVEKKHNTYVCGRCGSNRTDPQQGRILAMHIIPFGETIPSEAKDWTSQQYEQYYWRPYFNSMPDEHLRNANNNEQEHKQLPLIQAGDRFQTKEVDFKIVSCFPTIGVVDDNTQMFLVHPVSCLQSVVKATIAPLKESLDNVGFFVRQIHSDDVCCQSDIKDFVEEAVQPYFAQEHRQVVEGEVLMFNGVQMKVLQMEPSSGIVDETTTLFTESESLPDLEKVHLRPVYESLPNSEKQINEDLLFRKYLKGFLQGTTRCLKKGETVQVDGVDFYVVDALPEKGVVTFASVIFTEGGPISGDELRRIQLERDEQIARQLQEQMMREEYGDRPFLMGPGAMNLEARRATALIQQRLSSIIAQIPENHPQRPALLEMQRQLAATANSPEAFFELLQAARDGQVGHRGAASERVAQLPTSNYHRTSTDESNADLEAISCRICLSDYEEGEVLRTLPCFHRFHEGCIDKWLQRDNKCPICKTEV
jgi:hypothetical protein